MTVKRPERGLFWYLLRENGLQLAMIALGAVLVGWFHWVAALVYLLWAVSSNIFYMYWVCPTCGHYALGTCPAGFDLLSRRRFRLHAGWTFRGQFRLGVLVLAPGWFLPLLVGVVLLVVDFSWVLFGLLAAFCLLAFWLLPQASRAHCADCETTDCPHWKPKKGALHLQ